MTREAMRREWLAMDALLTLSSKGQLVIPARLRHGSGKTSNVRALIGCTGYSGPPIPLDQQDPALYARKVGP